MSECKAATRAGAASVPAEALGLHDLPLWLHLCGTGSACDVLTPSDESCRANTMNDCYQLRQSVQPPVPASANHTATNQEAFAEA